MTPISEIVRTMTEAQKSALLSAQPADSYEWWLTEEINDPRLAGPDWVLTDLGEQCRAYLETKS